MKMILIAAVACAGFQALAADRSELEDADYMIPSVQVFESTRDRALACLNAEGTKAMLGARFQETANYYAGFETKISEASLGTNRVALQRSYLAHRKLYKYCSRGKLENIGPKPVNNGKHDENSPFLGNAAADFAKMKENPDSRLLRFGNALYSQNGACPGQPGDAEKPEPQFMMIPFELKAQADKEAAALLLAKVQTKGLKSAAGLFGTGYVRSVVMTSAIDNDWNNWEATAFVEARDTENVSGGKKYHTPLDVIRMHELHHVEQRLPGEKPNNQPDPNQQALDEVGCVIHQIVATDEVYKKIKGIPLNGTVAYPKDYPAGMKLGEVANFFRPLLQKYPSVEMALLGPEAKAFMKKHFPADVACKKSFPPRLQRVTDKMPMPSRDDNKGFSAPSAR